MGVGAWAIDVSRVLFWLEEVHDKGCWFIAVVVCPADPGVELS